MRNDHETVLADYRAIMGFVPPNREKIQLALEYSHRIREFEINLYWTRTNYFWGFQVAFFAAFGLLAQAAVADGAKEAKLVWLLASACLICLFAAAFCLLWQFMLMGAKFWQDNWERHVDAIEDEVTGPLYKTYFVPNYFGQGKRPFSVTRINQAIVWLVLCLWTLLFLGTAIFLFSQELVKCFFEELNFGILVLLSILIIWLAIPLVTSDRLRMSNLGKTKSSSPNATHRIVGRDALEP